MHHPESYLKKSHFIEKIFILAPHILLASGNLIVDVSFDPSLSPRIYYPPPINYTLLMGFLVGQSQLNFYGYTTDLSGNNSYYLIKSEFGSGVYSVYSEENLANDHHEGGSFVQVGNRTWIVGGQNTTGKNAASLNLSLFQFS
jgi:hypothetical protein